MMSGNEDGSLAFKRMKVKEYPQRMRGYCLIKLYVSICYIVDVTTVERLCNRIRMVVLGSEVCNLLWYKELRQY